MIVIFSFSAQDTTQSHATSGRFIHAVASATVEGFDDMTADEQAIVYESLDYPIRKAGHLSEYAILGVLLYIALGTTAATRKRDMRRFLVTIGAVFAYACTDEFHQLFVYGRTGCFKDVLIDTLGALVAVLIACGIRSLWMAAYSDLPESTAHTIEE